MLELIDQGKVRWGGVSSFDVSLLSRRHMIDRWTQNEFTLSLINRASATSVIPRCRANGVGVIVDAPLATGRRRAPLTAQIANLSDDDGRRRLARFQEPQLSRTLGFVDHLRPMADRLGLSAATLAIAWALVTPGVTGAIAGARTPVQVDGRLSASDIQLSKEGLAQIDAAIAETGV